MATINADGLAKQAGIVAVIDGGWGFAHACTGYREAPMASCIMGQCKLC
jgi:hypothetical protein